MKSIVITGATGFLGSRLTLKLLQSQENQLFLLHRGTSSLSSLRQYELQNIHLINVEQPNALAECFEHNRIDCVIHTATNYGKENISAEEVVKANLILPLRILEFATMNQTPHFINLDTALNKHHANYEFLFNYTQTKKFFVSWLKHYAERIRVSNLIVEYMYGPGDRNDKFVTRFIQSARLNFSDDLLLTPGEQNRDFVYIDDVVSAIETVILGEKKYDFKSFEVGSGTSTSLVEFAQHVLEAIGSKATPPFGGISHRAGEIMDSRADISALVEMGWMPKTSLRQGIMNTVKHDLELE